VHLSIFGQIQHDLDFCNLASSLKILLVQISYANFENSLPDRRLFRQVETTVEGMMSGYSSNAS